MEDADPYNRTKYPPRPAHQHRPSNQFLPEISSAAQRYSPMNAQPTSAAYVSSPKSQNPPSFSYLNQPQQSRQSPTRQGSYNTERYTEPPTPTRYTSTYSPAMQNPDVSPESYYPASAGNTHPTSLSRQQSQGPGPVPSFKKVKTIQELNTKINAQPPYRRANPEGGFISPLQALTTYLPATYRICNPSFKYESSRNPRRVLTKPSKGTKNDGYDNDDSDYILYVNDILGSEEAGHKNRYLILDVLGQGTFGQVVKCQNLRTQEVVAVKVIKNRTAYFNQSMMEVSVLDLLNQKLDKNDDHHLLRLKDTFIHRQHLCLVFELLSVNLYELIKQNQFRGLSTTLVRVFAQQLLNGLALLNKARLIHCDLKPENILLKNLESPIIKIIDFGSACDERQTVYTYIQSRFYRSPEVLLGLPYSSAIDMWSLGCIVVELFLGLPLFPGSSEYNQVSRIVEMLGMPPMWMLEMGKQSGEFFEKTTDEFGRRTYRLKSMEQYSREHNVKEQPSKKYFQATTLPEIIRSYSMPRKNMKQAEVERGNVGGSMLEAFILTSCRNEQPRRLHRLCAWAADHQPSGTMVSPAGKTTSLHHPTKVHSAFRSSHEPKVSVQQNSCAWRATTATSRGFEQTTGRPGGSCPSAGCPSSPSTGTGADGGSKCLRHADESISSNPTSAHVQHNVPGPSAGCSSAVSHSFRKLSQPDGHDGTTDPSDDPKPLQSPAELIRSSYAESRPTACVHHGSATGWHSCSHSTSC